MAADLKLVVDNYGVKRTDPNCRHVWMQGHTGWRCARCEGFRPFDRDGLRCEMCRDDKARNVYCAYCGNWLG